MIFPVPDPHGRTYGRRIRQGRQPLVQRIVKALLGIGIVQRIEAGVTDEAFGDPAGPAVLQIHQAAPQQRPATGQRDRIRTDLDVGGDQIVQAQAEQPPVTRRQTHADGGGHRRADQPGHFQPAGLHHAQDQCQPRLVVFRGYR